ncbi:hypothetical protein N9Y17_00710 [Gammaproteobacteria bacterium]|nr:hypothetical protein [Gammaproteobacteria bacterium]
MSIAIGNAICPGQIANQLFRWIKQSIGFQNLVNKFNVIRNKYQFSKQPKKHFAWYTSLSNFIYQASMVEQFSHSQLTQAKICFIQQKFLGVILLTKHGVDHDN